MRPRSRLAALAAVAALVGMVGSLTLAGCSGPGTVTPQAETPTPAAAPATGSPSVSPRAVASPATYTASPDPSRVAWTFATGGAIYGGATVSAGSVYFGSDDRYLYAVDLASHRLRWKFKTGGLVRSTPAVAGELVYAASDDGNVYALRAADGGQAWKAFIGDNVERVSPDSGGAIWDFHESSPVVSGDTVYVGSADGHLYALAASSGALRWRFRAQGMVRATPLVADGIVYFGSWMSDVLWGSTTYALDATTGSQMWTFEGAGDHPTPRLVNGLLYVGGRQGYLYALEASSVRAVWQADFQRSWVESSPAYDAGRIFVGSSALGLVQAFDAGSGKVLWQFAPTGFPWSSPAVYGGIVYIGSADYEGNPEVGLWAIDALSGRGLWRVAALGRSLDTSTSKLFGFVAGPTIADGRVYVGALDGRLYAIDTD